MKKLNDKKLLALGIVLVIFTFGYFLIVNKISYAFVNNYDPNNVYDETSALKYGNDNVTVLEQSENKTIYPKVQDLIDSGYLVPNNENGLLINPMDTSENFNSTLIKIKYENGQITAHVEI